MVFAILIALLTLLVSFQSATAADWPMKEIWDECPKKLVRHAVREVNSITNYYYACGKVDHVAIETDNQEAAAKETVDNLNSEIRRVVLERFVSAMQSASTDEKDKLLIAGKLSREFVTADTDELREAIGTVRTLPPQRYILDLEVDLTNVLFGRSDDRDKMLLAPRLVEILKIYTPLETEILLDDSTRSIGSIVLHPDGYSAHLPHYLDAIHSMYRQIVNIAEHLPRANILSYAELLDIFSAKGVTIEQE